MGEDRNMGGSGDMGDTTEGGVGGNTELRGARNNGGDGERTPDKQAAYADWKAREGQTFEDAFEKNRMELKDKRAEMKEALLTANTKKREIDEAKERLARKQADKGPDNGHEDELIDEEEYALIKGLKETKQQYREAFEKHKSVKAQVVQLEHQMAQTKAQLVTAFEEWYDVKYGSLLRSVEAPIGEVSGERYDPQEMFDLMQSDRLETQHPDALAYHKARKTAARDVRQRRGASTGGV